ncbi:hypothetical protein BpHYR1_012590 [Brachionus plicatilis]|uniref:Uncharacterized protein n=1 Tax=Brachionus plicatilis TaxID=10195 RepID=A0A3M7T2G9_BRAPC|nr:hypothetical protein BpHYR1_012590 [Brachionus plicatilis]
MGLKKRVLPVIDQCVSLHHAHFSLISRIPSKLLEIYVTNCKIFVTKFYEFQIKIDFNFSFFLKDHNRFFDF